MIRSRIAPTPSGYPHTGNALNFVLTWLYTRSQNGNLLLRIDDLDSPRVKQEYLNDIFNTLIWLGLDWDEGPHSAEEQTKKYSQALRKNLYADNITTLIKSGLVFACNCSRKDLQASPGNLCPCRQKNLPLNAPDSALRIYTPEKTIIVFSDFTGKQYQVNLCDSVRDFVIRRRDGLASYQVASLCDDTYFNMTLLIRGEDLLASTAAQLYLAQFLPGNSFNQTKFYHHSLIKDEQGQKLSKSSGSTSIKRWREQHEKPEKFYLMLSNIMGWTVPFSSASQMLASIKSGKSSLPWGG